MQNLERDGYWIIQWSEDWGPSLADILQSVPELVCGKRIVITSCDSGPYVCSGLMYPDTDLGENARHGEVFDEQAKTYVFP